MYEVLFQYGPITIHTFNLFLALAFLLGMLFLLRYISRNKMNVSFLANNFIFMILASALGGRVFYVIENNSHYIKNILQAFYIWDLKLSAFGAFYGLIIVLYLLSRKSEEDFYLWLDAISLSGLVGLILIHVCHFFNGSYYGTPTTMPWGISFDAMNIPLVNTPLHPAQLYSALATFLILSYVMKYNRKTHLSGMAGSLAIMLYSVSAFGIDFLHGVPSSCHKVNFLIFTAVAFVLFIHCSHKKHLIKE